MSLPFSTWIIVFVIDRSVMIGLIVNFTDGCARWTAIFEMLPQWEQLILVHICSVLGGKWSIRTSSWWQYIEMGTQLVRRLIAGPAIYTARWTDRRSLLERSEWWTQRCAHLRRWAVCCNVSTFSWGLTLAPLCPTVLLIGIWRGIRCGVTKIENGQIFLWGNW